MANPIITTNVPGCKDVVEDGIIGFLCEKHNIEDLAARMEQVIRLSKEELLQMGKSGRAKVIKEFDEPLVNSKYINAIQEILAVR
jgi:glycosyltransferase involved in cell wall biosynthesis